MLENLVLASAHRNSLITAAVIICLIVWSFYIVWRLMLCTYKMRKRKKKEKLNLIVWLLCLKNKKILIIYNIIFLILNLIVMSAIICNIWLYANATFILIRNIILYFFMAFYGLSLVLAVKGVFEGNK